jgi:hypothetical protein
LLPVLLQLRLRAPQSPLLMHEQWLGLLLQVLVAVAQHPMQSVAVFAGDLAVATTP